MAVWMAHGLMATPKAVKSSITTQKSRSLPPTSNINLQNSNKGTDTEEGLSPNERRLEAPYGDRRALGPNFVNHPIQLLLGPSWHDMKEPI